MSTTNTDCWETLGITPTPCENRIQKAYTRQLCLHDPDSFVHLRQARDAAMTAARTLPPQDMPPPSAHSETERTTPAVQAEPPTPEPEPVLTQDALISAATELYDNFERRLRIQEWQQLLASPLLQDADAMHELRRVLFGFFDDRFYLPQPVLDLLRKTFDWQHHYDALIEAYGEHTTDTLLDFFEYNRWNISFENLRVPAHWTSEQVDRYLQLRERLAIAARKGNQAAFAERVAALQATDIGDVALHTWLALRYLANGQLDEAQSETRLLEQHAPHHLDTLLLSARVHVLTQQPQAAAKAFRAVLKIDDRHVLAIKGLADDCLQSGYSDEARALYERVLELTPFDMEARLQIMLINQDRLENAFADVAPNTCSLAYSCDIAHRHIQNGDYDGCVRFVSRLSLLARRNDHTLPQELSDSPFANLYQALIARPGGLKAEELPARLYEIQGDACQALGDHMNALMLYKHAAALARAQGENAVAATLKWARLELEEYQDADAALDLAAPLCEQAPTLSEAWHLKAEARYQQALEQQQAVDSALPAIDQAIRLEPGNWHYHSLRALILFDSGRYAEALEDTNITLHSQYRFSWAWYRKAVCLRELGHADAAAEAFETAIKQVTAADAAAEALAWLAIEQSWLETARSALQACIDYEGDPDSIAQLQDAIARCAEVRACSQGTATPPASPLNA